MTYNDDHACTREEAAALTFDRVFDPDDEDRAPLTIDEWAAMKRRDYPYYRFALKVVGKNDRELVETISSSDGYLSPTVWMEFSEVLINLGGQYKDTGRLFEAAGARVLIAMAKIDPEG